ncbi:sensor histidine kinase [Ectobacillus panaciterrae]|uniref:sensor histidine kinase n=1 Tax=Ectobacillus panaciterrae TaxID=363872 RepID=UPI00040F9E68|nr:HAMP domain-containing sensor histidine kinase [Ectobacillus panaciterrae]
MKHISIKLGFYFLICVTLIEVILFALLYYSLVNTRVDEEVASLLTRGNSHRDVLEKYFDPQTIMHVALMESEAETKVVITSNDGSILAKSNNVDPAMEEHLYKKMGPVPKQGTVIENHWKTSNYICTVSPIQIQGDTKGYVYMFLGTDSIKEMIQRLTNQFLLIAAITFLLTAVTMFLLSRILTQPLIRMKKATEKLSKGDLSVSLNMKSNDEVGELGQSIQTLANDLNYMKKERSEFLASVAHELRTPLTYVRGYADIAMRDTLSQEERNTYLTIIKDEADHLTGLVQDLFELAQMEKHNFIIEKQETNIYDFLEKIVAKVQPAYEDKQIQIVLSCPKDLAAPIDQKRFEQVIMNLLNNAFFHSEPNSTTSITVTNCKLNIQIGIQDEGEGIPPKDLPHIFERFYRVDKSRTRATGGSGLGLAIVKEIVELHGGTITVESKLGEGSAFTITLKK